MSCPSLRKRSPKMPARVRPLSRRGHGRAARFRCLRRARRVVTRWGRPGTCAARRGMRPMPLVRRRSWRMWPPTSWARQPMPSGPRRRQPLTTSASKPAVKSASGSAISFPTRFGSLCLMTSGYVMTYAGLCLTANLYIAGFVRHAHNARGELADDLDQIILRGNHLFDVFVRLGRFVKAAAQQRDAALFQIGIALLLGNGLERAATTHLASRAVRGGVERTGNALAAHQIARVAHRTGDNAQHARSGRRGALAMDNGAGAVSQGLAPGEVMMVLDVGNLLQPHRARDAVVNDVVVGGGEAPGQFHREPVFLSGLRIQGKPGEMAQRLIQGWMQAARNLGIGVGDLEANAARAAVREQRQILARLQPQIGVVNGQAQDAPLDEVVASAGGA